MGYLFHLLHINGGILGYLTHLYILTIEFIHLDFLLGQSRWMWGFQGTGYVKNFSIPMAGVAETIGPSLRFNTMVLGRMFRWPCAGPTANSFSRYTWWESCNWLGGWTNPFGKICASQIGSWNPRDENKKYLSCHHLGPRCNFPHKKTHSLAFGR